MIATSAEYKQAVLAHRHHWTFRATIDYTDYNLDGSIATSVHISDRLSDDTQLTDGIEVNSWKFFPSWDRFRFGEGYRLRSEHPTRLEKGSLSHQMSDGGRDFHHYGGHVAGYTVPSEDNTLFVAYTNVPRFTVSFAPRTVDSLLVTFDQMLGEWAEEFDVDIYIGESLDASEQVVGNTTWRWAHTLDYPVLGATRIDVLVRKWNYPWSKAKVVESFTSVREEYDMDDIIGLAMAEESEPDDSTVPIGNVTANSCNLALINEFRKFDNDNPDSMLAGNIIKNRRIKLYAQLAEQEVPLGTFYTKRWEIDNPRIEAEVSGQDIISLMGDQTYKDSRFIDPQDDVIDETYSTDSQFNAFTRDNVISVDDTMVMGGAALLGNELGAGVLSGYYVYGTVPTGQQYFGTATRTISFTYTPGTTVRMSVTIDATLPTGTGYIVYANHRTVPQWRAMNGDYVFTPEDITATDQTVSIRILLFSYSADVSPQIHEIAVGADESVSLFSLAAMVFEDFDAETGLLESRYTIDEAFGDVVIPNAFFEPQSMRSVLRKITEAGAGRAYVDRHGGVVVTVVPDPGSPVKTYDPANYFEIVQPVNAEAIYNRVTVVTQTMELSSSTDAIGTVEAAPGTHDYVVEYTAIPAVFDSFDEPANVSVIDHTAYTWGMDITIENTGASDARLGIIGYPYETRSPVRVSRDDTESIRRSGIMEYVIEGNPVIQTVAQATMIAERMIASFSRIRRQMRIEAVPDLALEVGDTVLVDGLQYVVNSTEVDVTAGQVAHVVGGKA